VITLKNVTLRRGAKVLARQRVCQPQPERKGRPGRAATAQANRRSSRCSNGSLHEDAGEFNMPAQWRMGQVAQDMPETEPEAPPTFVVEGDTRAAGRAGKK
jgi:ATP-binding cassette subfamily F protein 3